ncbi:hypothetical protein DFJ58DRAFT_766347 [Suillus subalutaceus]|uniref:uncharacterized protein n=1 Tax=Suillus subalutaceus TaxID=48586 RepID=UPI001B86417D|nr:uncharacterized protein DFJ58DRAFT_766347 [Suillus subalutaceus]KAG1869466.1 hypothetical protein DFJ58DRAFT_766347 [Suillus subalutaceus]
MTLTLMRLRLVLTTAEITLRRLRSIRFLPCVLLVFSYSLPLSRLQDSWKISALPTLRSSYLSFCRGAGLPRRSSLALLCRYPSAGRKPLARTWR